MGTLIRKSVTLSAMLFVLVLHSFAQSVTLPTFSNIDDAMHWVYSNIEYIPAPRSVANAQTPEQTIQLGTGSCTDQAVLLLALVKNSKLDRYVFECRLAGIQQNGDPSTNHLIIYVGYFYYDATSDVRYSALPKGYREIAIKH